MRVALDLSYEDKMRDREVTSLVQQIMYCYGVNNRSVSIGDTGEKCCERCISVPSLRLISASADSMCCAHCTKTMWAGRAVTQPQPFRFCLTSLNGATESKCRKIAGFDTWCVPYICLPCVARWCARVVAGCAMHAVQGLLILANACTQAYISRLSPLP